MADRDLTADAAARARIAAHPVEFCRDILGFEPWSKQREVLEAVRDHPRVAVRASHGVGKTMVGAHVVLWFLTAFRDSRVICTAPTWSQIENLLFRALRKAAAGSRIPFPPANNTKLELGDNWFAIGLSTNEPERFQGHHADHILLVVDEASGVDEKIFQAAEGFLTAEGAHLLLLGNPTKTGGQFHRAFMGKESAQWRKIHIGTEHTPNYTGEAVSEAVARSLPRKEWAGEKAAAWGKGSPMYEVRVDGNFPSRAANAVVSLVDVENAQACELEPGGYGRTGTIGVDVARYGDDDTVLAFKHGPVVRIREIIHGQPTTAITGAVVRLAKTVREETGALPTVVVDDVGVGGGVTDGLREQLPDHKVIAFNGGHAAIDPEEYPNRRSELWFVLAGMLPDLDLDGDDQLAADLTSPTYKLNSAGQRVVEPKAETKKRLGRSPDRADAVMLSLVRPHDPGLAAHPVTAPAQSPSGLGGFEGPRPTGATLTGDLLDDPS